MHPHTFLRWQRNRGNTIFSLTSRKTEIATSAWEPKQQTPLAGDALAKLYFVQKSLVIWQRRITKSSIRDVNPDTITGTLSWYKILPLSGFNLIRVKTKILHETEKRLRKFLDPSQKTKVIYTDNSLEFGKSCEDLTWNHRTSTLHRSETNDIAARAFRRVEEGTSAVLLQSGLDERWWSDSMECYCSLQNVQDFLTDVKTPYERRFGEPFKGPIILFGAMVEYHPSSPKDQARDYEFRVPTLRREQRARSEDLSGEIHGESGESQPAEPTDDAETVANFWSIQGDFIYRHQIEPRVQLYVPKEETFLFPLM